MRKLIEDGGDLKLCCVLCCLWAVSSDNSSGCISTSNLILIWEVWAPVTSSESDQTWPVCWTGGHVGQSKSQNWVLVDLNFNSKLNCPSFPPTRKSTRYSGMKQVDNNPSCILHCTALPALREQKWRKQLTTHNSQYRELSDKTCKFLKTCISWKYLQYTYQPASQQSSINASLLFIILSNFGKNIFLIEKILFTNVAQVRGHPTPWKCRHFKKHF